VRIRLEGALEIIERATADYERALRLFGGRWHFEADGHRPALQRLIDEEDAVLDAAEKVDAMAVAEKWPESFAGARMLGAFHLARSTLHERLKVLETESGVEANGALPDSLAQLLELAWAPGRSPVYFCRGFPLWRWWLFSSVRLELYTGRLRIAGRGWARELPLSRDGLEPSSLGRVKVRGVGAAGRSPGVVGQVDSHRGRRCVLHLRGPAVFSSRHQPCVRHGGRQDRGVDPADGGSDRLGAVAVAVRAARGVAAEARSGVVRDSAR